MTEQEARDIDVLRMLVSTGALNAGNAKMITRVCDGFVEKCARLACLTEAVTAALPSLDAAVTRHCCPHDDCGTVRCRNGYLCPAGGIRRATKDLRRCLGAGEEGQA